MTLNQARGLPGDDGDEPQAMDVYSLRTMVDPFFVGSAGALAMDVYTLHTMADGSIRGRVWTNDDDDLGIPSAEAEWEVQYPDRPAMESRTGKSHVGVSGVVVEVILDGRKI